jgi:hypothetical protein
MVQYIKDHAKHASMKFSVFAKGPCKDSKAGIRIKASGQSPSNLALISSRVRGGGQDSGLGDAAL